jgi:hypothetical protein
VQLPARVKDHARRAQLIVHQPLQLAAFRIALLAHYQQLPVLNNCRKISTKAGHNARLSADLSSSSC